MHLAAESHVDRSISALVCSSRATSSTYNLLQAVRGHYEGLSGERGMTSGCTTSAPTKSLDPWAPKGASPKQRPTTPAATPPARRPVITSFRPGTTPLGFLWCSPTAQTTGPWQFPEKLIPVVTLKAAGGESIPLYGDGLNVRDWLYVEDHVDALLLAACNGTSGRSYCVGGHGERTNKEVVTHLPTTGSKPPRFSPHADLITPVTDRPATIAATRLTQAASVPSWAGALATMWNRA